MSLRTKFMLALLLTGLAAVAMVGGLAYTGMTRKVDSIRREQAMEHFMTATAYVQQYGSWQASPGKDGFDNSCIARAWPQPQVRKEDRPPPPEGRPAAARRWWTGTAVRGGVAASRHSTSSWPIRITMWCWAPASIIWRALPESARKDARAVEVKAAWWPTFRRKACSRRASRNSSIWTPCAMRCGSASGAAVLALALGLLLSRSLGRTLGHLTSAVRAMHGGSLLQRVPVEGKDEVAELAAAFNDMSEKLARTHEELHESHQTILAGGATARAQCARCADQAAQPPPLRRAGHHLFSHAVRHKRPFSVVIGDIDFFKRSTTTSRTPPAMRCCARWARSCAAICA
jgi:HAMP domain-containing protein